MEESSKKILILLQEIDLPDNLERRVVVNLRTSIKRVVWYRLGVSSTVSLLSLVILVVGLHNLSDNLDHSGISEYLSLIYSDNTLLLSYWREFISLLVESLPWWSLIAPLGAFVVFLWTASQATEDITKVFLTT